MEVKVDVKTEIKLFRRERDDRKDNNRCRT